MSRLNIERQKELEPKRMEYAIKCITELGYKVNKISETELSFDYNGQKVTLFPYSGWHTGKTIKDGRGLSKLLSQIKPQK